MPGLGAHVPEGEELVGHLGRSREVAGPGEAQQKQVQDQALGEQEDEMQQIEQVRGMGFKR